MERVKPDQVEAIIIIIIITITITPGGGQGGMQEHFMYRLIVRTSELLPLRSRQMLKNHLKNILT